MSKKNSSANLKKFLGDFKDFDKIYLNFKNKLNKLKKKTYVVAVSGGPDSLALVALTKVYSLDKSSKFHYILVNHNIRENSSLESKKVKLILKKKKINLKILNNNIKISANIQNQARILRYKMMVDYCQKNKIKTILTAHNLEDQVETFFIRLSRGSGLKGLSSMRYSSNLENNVKLIRPLLDTKKKYLVKITEKMFGKYINDPSNLDKKFLRTKIRNLKSSLEKSGINYDQIIKSIHNLASSNDILDSYYSQIFKKVVKASSKQILINLDKFGKYENEIKIWIINSCIKILKKNYYNPRTKKVIYLIGKLGSKKFKKSTLGGCVFEKNDPLLSIKLEKK